MLSYLAELLSEEALCLHQGFACLCCSESRSCFAALFRVHLSSGQLPEAFEGEERSVAGVGDVLQLVSGRQLLGLVRERQDAQLPGQPPSAMLLSSKVVV